MYASYEELSAQMQADSGLDSNILGLLGFFAVAGSLLVRVDHAARPRIISACYAANARLMFCLMA